MGLLSAVAAALALAVCVSPAWAASPLFHDATVEAGISFTQTALSDTPGYLMHDGGAVGDFNRDGWPDVFIVGGGLVPDGLFINQKNGTFVNEAATWFAPAANQPLLYRGNGANVGDYNKDLCLDIFVTSHGDLPGAPEKGKHRLYRNNCNGTFTNVAAAAGVNETAPYPDGYGVTFGDYDLDGNLDLWVGGWHLDNGGDSLGTRLFHNNGNGTFTDVSVAAQIADVKVRGFGAIFADTNDDRHPELLVAGDVGSSRYCHNDRNGQFRCYPLVPPDQVAWNGMGTTLADFNRDGRMDWYIGAIFPAFGNEGPPGNRLYMNDGGDEFTALPPAAGVNDGGWCWGVASPDVNNDGLNDLVQTNGWPNCDPVTGECFDPEPTYVWRNNGDLTFTEIHAEANLIHMGEGRGLMTLDYDQDGDMDVLNLTNNGDLMLFRNDLIPPGGVAPPDAGWLEVVLDTRRYPELPPNGFGAHLILQAPSGTQQTFRINGGSNYLSNSEQIAHFGMANAASSDLTVMWPSGFQQVRKDVGANQRLRISARRPYKKFGNSLVVNGLFPGEEATFLTSTTGLGQGPCYPLLGGLCIDLLPPITTLGTAIADADGTATFILSDSVRTPPAATFSQVTVMRGGAGVASLKSNTIRYHRLSSLAR